MNDKVLSSEINQGGYISRVQKIVYPFWTEPKRTKDGVTTRKKTREYLIGDTPRPNIFSDRSREKKTTYPEKDKTQLWSSGKAYAADERSKYRSKHTEQFSFEATLQGGFVLKVYNASITQVPVEAIVNAANDVMAHEGGVAKVISEAAGPSLDRESKRYVNSHGPVKVGKNIVTTAGRLPFRAVIHTVGPEWRQYREKIDCLDDLFDSVYNILETSKKQQLKTVAMTAISAGIFGVPKELCADMYVYAAANFSKTHLPTENPKELHIIDLDVRILQYVEESVKRWKKDPESLNPRITVPKFLEENPHLATFSSYNKDNHAQTEGERYRSSSKEGIRGPVNGDSQDWGQKSTSKLAPNISRIEDHRFSWGGVAKQFLFDKQILVKIYNGDIAKVQNMDAIVCGTGKNLKPIGSIANALKHKGGSVYARSSRCLIEKHRFDNLKYADVFKCEGGNLNARYVLHAVVKKLVEADTLETVTYQDCIYSILQKAKRNDWKTIGIPLIGIGPIQTNKRKLKLCGTALLRALDEFMVIQGDKHNLKEIHLVNSNHIVCEALEEVFGEAVADRQYVTNSSKLNSSRQSNKNHSSEFNVNKDMIRSDINKDRIRSDVNKDMIRSDINKDRTGVKEAKGHGKRKTLDTRRAYSDFSKGATNVHDGTPNGGDTYEDESSGFDSADEDTSDHPQQLATKRQTDQRMGLRKPSDSNVSVGNLKLLES